MNFFLAVASSILFGLLSAFTAYRRKRNPYIWFFIGFVFGLFGVIAIVLLPLTSEQEISQPPPQPQPFIDGPIDRFWYYLDPLNQQHGPMSRDALTAAWKKGALTHESFVWHEELPAWKPLQELIKYQKQLQPSGPQKHR